MATEYAAAIRDARAGQPGLALGQHVQISPDLEARLFDRVKAAEGLSPSLGPGPRSTSARTVLAPGSRWSQLADSARRGGSASYVVGCDEAGGAVGDLLKVEQRRPGLLASWLVVDVALHEPRGDPPNLQVCRSHRHHDRRYLAGRVGAGGSSCASR